MRLRSSTTCAINVAVVSKPAAVRESEWRTTAPGSIWRPSPFRACSMALIRSPVGFAMRAGDGWVRIHQEIRIEQAECVQLRARNAHRLAALRKAMNISTTQQADATPSIK